MNDPNRREYTRAKVRLFARFRILDRAEEEGVKKGMAGSHLRGGHSIGPLEELVEQIAPGSVDEPLLRCLQFINNKIDFIIDEITSPSKAGMSGPCAVTEISGSGFRLDCDIQLSRGQLLKVDLLMPSALQYRIELIAKVVRVDEVQQEPGQDRKWLSVSARFVEIDEESRESIIRAVFSRLRERIRMEKTGLGD
jgi:PilZ domain